MIDASICDGPEEARAFADSIAGTLARLGYTPPRWRPGEVAEAADERELAVLEALGELGWYGLAHQPQLAACAGLGAVALGRSLAPIEAVDALLGASPLAGELVRALGRPTRALVRERGRLLRRRVLTAQPCPSAEGLRVWRVQLDGPVGQPVPSQQDPIHTGGNESPESALTAWLAASIGYLGGLGLGALELTVDYARGRRAFGATLATLATVQQMLAGAATSVRGVRLLAAHGPGADTPAHEQVGALLYAGEAIVSACAACQQVSGAIGFTLEYPLHRYAQRARALATWSDALAETLIYDCGQPDAADADG